ncbi:uncharacterized protein LOC121423060 [Lytechinus variegatus]|uniref:uncharacterized protein LOC121423060 n=1 Tax=Lytechinus variegatus TaxID=7654 RepID=UPI001BB130EA|nr:uncharacterized protein LOC121423060 [Lytechinus variegatus]
MPSIDWGIQGTSSPGHTHADDSDQPFMLLTTKKHLIRPYSSSHIQASLRRHDRDAVIPRSRTAVRRTTAVNGGMRPLAGNYRAASAAASLRVSPMKTRVRSANCKSNVVTDDELEIDYRRIEDEDPDRMTESDVYQEVRKLKTQNNYEHESLRGGISPSIVQASKKLQTSKCAGVTVVRIGSQYHDGLKVTGVPIKINMDLMQKDEDVLSECSIPSEDICECPNCRDKKATQELRDQELDDTLLKSDESMLMVVSKSLGVTSPVKRPSSNTQHNRRSYSKDVVPAQAHKDKNSERPIPRSKSARTQVYSPSTLKIDSDSLPVVSSRSITGPRIRYEVTSSLSTKAVEDDNDSVISGSGDYLNKQIEAVAKAQDTIEHYPNVDERPKMSSEIPIFSWRPALKDILRSKSVSLRRRSMGCIYADSTSPAKCLKHGKKCPEIPKTVEDNVTSGGPSSYVWSRGRRLNISIDMRSIRLPPILSYSQRSAEGPSDCAACVAGVSC